jgi:DNA-binding NtrC family response regulator
VSAPAGSVLVVEDDPALRLLCRVNLELDGLSVREAATVGAARDAVSHERPAVVFLDVHLGGSSADDLLDELRSDGIPVVLVSGSADVDRYRDRVTELLTKPFEPAALVAAAKRYVG